MRNRFEENPLVSIIIPCYNHADFVQDCIKSVIKQDYKNIELIIIDDGSKDSSVKKIKEMIPACKKRFVRFEFRCRPNKGLCGTLNEAIEWCRGMYISPFASDDVALSHKTSFLVKNIRNTDFAAVFGTVEIYGSSSYENKLWKKNIIHRFEDLIFGLNLPSAPAALIDLNKVRQVCGYKENLPIEDWYMWLRLTEAGGALASFHEVVALYRRHDGNTTNNQEKMQRARLLLLRDFQNNRLYKKAVKYSFLQSARDFAYSNKIHAMKMFALSLPPRRNTFFILLKIITPRFVLSYLKSGK